MLLRKQSSNSDHQNIRSHVTAVPHLVGKISANNISVDIVVVSFTEGENHRPVASH
jgi:hypothetical protein